MSVRIKILLADDHPALLLGLQSVVTAIPTLSLVGSASCSTDIVQCLDTTPCDVLVTDYAMPSGAYGDGISMIRLLQRRYPQLHFVVMSMLDNPAILKSLLAAHISCIVSKADDPSHIVPAIHAAYVDGNYYSPSVRRILDSTTPGTRNPQTPPAFSQRESEVVRLFVAGLSVSEIAERLHRSKQTISTQKNSAMRKLGLTRDADLYTYAIRNGLLTATAEPAQEAALPAGGDTLSG